VVENAVAITIRRLVVVMVFTASCPRSEAYRIQRSPAAPILTAFFTQRYLSSLHGPLIVDVFITVVKTIAPKASFLVSTAS
jgi:hypothetical protein